MGRFGNVMLINGETRFSAGAVAGEVLRLYLLDTANTRIFNVGVRGARMKLVGGDSGRYEREKFVDEVLLSPSERMVLDILFEKPGEASFQHRTPEKTYELGAFSVEEGKATSSASSFAVLRSDPELNSLRESIGDDLKRSPDKVLAFVASMPLLYRDEAGHASAYVCPMHPEVTSTEPGACPKCGMKLIPAQPEAKSYVCPMHPDVSAAEPGTCPRCGMRLMPSDAPSVPSSGMHESHEHGGHHGDDGLEWEDLMPEINRATDPSNMIWKIIDRETGAENAAISWRFAVGDKVKMRLVNEMESDHPMHHPFHIHGAGRFLILSRNGRPESNLVWKDTVLLRAGETVDILLYVTNPGLWMAHCHIAEHTESGMMFSFEVTP
jgi:FtsP/CotA-like multicopper oxidase with cupredoxin domain